MNPLDLNPFDNLENWRAITNSALGLGDVVQEGDVTYRITGFGPYFFWGVSSKTRKETRLPGYLLDPSRQ